MGERLGKEMSDLQFYTMQDGGRNDTTQERLLAALKARIKAVGK